MIFGSVCSGIEAASVAWHGLGWRPAWFSEIEKFPSRVLAHHYPEVPNLGDMRRIHESEVFRTQPINLLVGGTPCQSFSVAGLREGLRDPRGDLTLTYLAVAERARPRWLVWENVPGILSIDAGKAFGAFLGGLGELGYGFAYRVLDAQYFGVPQRRRRVFVVGCLGDWRSAAAVLFERHSLSWNSAPSRKEGQSASGCPTESTGDHGIPHTAGCLQERDSKGPDSEIKPGHLIPIPFDTTQITHPENRRRCEPGSPSPSLSSFGHAPAVAFSCKDYGADVSRDLAPTLRAMGSNDSHANGGGQLAIAIQEIGKRTGVSTKNPGIGMGISNAGDPMYTLQSGAQHGIGYRCQVRRLTPRECERLQGFPDDYTLIPVGKRVAADRPRYKALGNSMAVPVMRWIGNRIQMVDEIRAKNGTPDEN